MLKRRERRVPQQLGFGGTIKMHTCDGASNFALAGLRQAGQLRNIQRHSGIPLWLVISNLKRV
jgi:hypothetical protein